MSLRYEFHNRELENKKFKRIDSQSPGLGLFLVNNRNRCSLFVMMLGLVAGYQYHKKHDAKISQYLRDPRQGDIVVVKDDLDQNLPYAFYRVDGLTEEGQLVMAPGVYIYNRIGVEWEYWSGAYQLPNFFEVDRRGVTDRLQRWHVVYYDRKSLR